MTLLQMTIFDYLEMSEDQFDLIAGGFPCQSFSIAEKCQGFRDSTRGTFFEIIRLASILRLKYILLENVLDFSVVMTKEEHCTLNVVEEYFQPGELYVNDNFTKY
ncbi:DNA cytosine methyltransferase [Paenibacillus solisilvae]|uniref:DNA cytosine methyltransferase n=1 Tax=Paenibacillus solisilvae TaxID=2486751 RepID=A0ABW0VWN3_9BACL